MEANKELLSAEEFFNTKDFGTDFDFADEYANYHTEYHLKEMSEFIADKALLKIRDNVNDLDIMDDWSEIDKQSILNASELYIETNLKK